MEEDVEEMEDMPMKPVAIAPRMTEVKTLETLERAKRTLEKQASSLADDDDDLRVRLTLVLDMILVSCMN